ncbi:MAG: tRNA (adenosine(37)-N6)-threonylcarbamoyltransferase complex transferase subunit TsaD [Candidatus Omnitrophota bacterium]
MDKTGQVTIGIETSCDETAVAVVLNGKVLASEVSSSVHLHSQYGGVVPEIASRFHVEYIYKVMEKAMKRARCTVKDIALVTVTEKPGLSGSLLVGGAFAQAVAFSANVPVIGIDHLRAHILSSFLNSEERRFDEFFPFIGMVVSGGHTSIYICKNLKDFSLIGRTKDDAVGEAFDKVAKILGLGYPGGPVVEKRAGRFKGKDDIIFPRPLMSDKKDMDFSFSGIKTAVMYYWRASSKTEKEKDKICFAFQEAVIDVIDKKIARALRFSGLQRLAVGGGVINNKKLRNCLKMRAKEQDLDLFLPRREYCSDNAAMVAAFGEALYDAMNK